MSEATPMNVNGKRERSEELPPPNADEQADVGDSNHNGAGDPNNKEDSLVVPSAAKQPKTTPSTTDDEGGNNPSSSENAEPAGGDNNGSAANKPADNEKDDTKPSETTTAAPTESNPNTTNAAETKVSKPETASGGTTTDTAAGAADLEAAGIVMDRTGGVDPEAVAAAAAAAVQQQQQPAPGAASKESDNAPPVGLNPSFQPQPEAAAAASNVHPDAGAAHTTTAASGGNPDETVEERGEISVEIAGRVIGKGGEIIRDLQARSGAQIDVDQSALPGRPRVITYRGPRKKVEFAKHLVQLISSGVADTNLPLGDAMREALVIPSSATGKVIGRGGEMVREMQNRSHAKIDFDHNAQVKPDQKQVIITGTVQSVAKAKEMILFLVSNPAMEAMQALNMLVDEKLRGGGVWGSGPPYHNLPNSGTNMRPEMFAPDGGGGGAGYGAGAGGAYGGAGGPPGGGGYGGGYPGGQPMNPYGGGQPPQGYGAPAGGGGMGRYGAGPTTFSETMYAKKNFMGRIIGSKGITINDLQKRSGTDIQINQDVGPGQDCEISIKGSREGVEMAKSMIQQIIEIGPNHPFAGGQQAGGYGGGGGGYGGGYAPQAYGYGAQPYDYQQPPQQAYGQSPYDQPQQGYQDPQAAAYGGYQQPGGGFGAQQQGQYPPAQQGGYGGGPPMQGYGGQPAAMAGPYGADPMASQQQHQPPQQYGGYQQQPPTQPAPAPAMASAWKATSTPDGQTYYWNPGTGETTWEKPQGMP